MSFVASKVRVAGCPVQLVDICQDNVIGNLYLTTLCVEGHIHCTSGFMPLSDMPFDILNIQTAYITDASVIGRTDSDEFIFRYTLTLRSLLPYLLEGLDENYSELFDEKSVLHCRQED